MYVMRFLYKELLGDYPPVTDGSENGRTEAFDSWKRLFFVIHETVDKYSVIEIREKNLLVLSDSRYASV